MKYLLLIVIAFIALGMRKIVQKKETPIPQDAQNIYQFTVKDLQGNIFDFSELKGKKIMVVNTASKCGLTPQYKQLQALHEKYRDKGLVIVAFPSNDFLKQEPGTATEIAAFCELNYGITFPVLGKIKVKGKKKHPVYTFLTEKSKNGLKDSRVKWNFQKYLINREGVLEKVISPKTKPDAPEVLDWIEG